MQTEQDIALLFVVLAPRMKYKNGFIVVSSNTYQVIQWLYFEIVRNPNQNRSKTNENNLSQYSLLRTIHRLNFLGKNIQFVIKNLSSLSEWPPLCLNSLRMKKGYTLSQIRARYVPLPKKFGYQLYQYYSLVQPIHLKGGKCSDTNVLDCNLKL